MRRAATTVLVTLALLTINPLLRAQEEDNMPTVFIDEDFSEGMDNWWAEGSERVWVEDGRLHVDADPPPGTRTPGVATVWCKSPISGDVRIEFEAHVISSRGNFNNINFWFFFSDPSGTPMYETREQRTRGNLPREFGGNVATFLLDDRTRDDPDVPIDGHMARIRIRHCPGYELLGETYHYHCRPGHTYRFEIIRRDHFIEFRVDGNYLLGVHTPHRWEEGLIGLRTFRTYLWWDNIRVTALD